MMTLAFDGSEDHLANKKPMDFVGGEMLAFREELMKVQPVPTLKELKKQIIPPERVRRGKQSTNLDEQLLDEGMELYDSDGDDLDEDMEESNGSDEESNNENPEEQNDQPTETEVPVAALRENPVIGNQDLKLVGEPFRKIKDVKFHCSNSLLPCLIKLEQQLKTEARWLRKDGQQVNGVLKEAML